MGAFGASSFNLEKAIQTLLIVFISYPFGKLIVTSKMSETVTFISTFATFKVSSDKMNVPKLHLEIFYLLI